MNDSITIMFCGDVVNQFSEKQFIGESLKNVISSCDYSVVNFEGVIENDGVESHGMLQRRSTINNLKNAGFKMLLLANNHILDYGERGLKATLQCIQTQGLSHIGASVGYKNTYAPAYIKIKDKLFAFINFCEAQNGYYNSVNQTCGYAWMGAVEIPLMIQEAKKKADYVIVLPHAGLEHYKLPLPQFRDLYRRFCDLGADCVIASHPHIAQGIETYQKSIIAYSLGNLYFPRTPEAGISDEENSSFSLKVSFGENYINGFNIICHSMENLMVDTTDTHITPYNIDELSALLSEPVYTNKINEQNLHAFNDVLYKLITDNAMGVRSSDGLNKTIRKFIKLLFSFDKEVYRTESTRIKRLGHIFRNETYRYVFENYLKLIENEKSN